MIIKNADFKDLKEILELQRLAYHSEAVLNNNFSIPPLLQTLEDIEKEYQNGIFLKAVDENGAIIGSVRGYAKDCTLFIGKLIVHPDCQGKGIGTRLLLTLEEVSPMPRYELFTSSKSKRNIILYERLGYVKFAERQATPNLTFIYLEKKQDVCSRLL